MRKQDLKVGTDYAISRWDGDGPHQGTYLGEVGPEARKLEHPYRFQMAAPSGQYNSWKAGDRRTFTARHILQPWSEWLKVAEVRQQRRAEYDRLTDEVRRQMLAALAVLELTPRGLFDTATTLGMATVALNGEELVALAERFQTLARRAQP